MRSLQLGLAVCLAGAFAAPARAADVASSREVQSAVDAYLEHAAPDAALVGGAGQAGYDGGFWIRGGSFLLKLNLTLQSRWEGFDWDDKEFEPSPGGDLSGFSLPRATLKLSGDATCAVHYYAELEFGHAGDLYGNSINARTNTPQFIGNASPGDIQTFGTAPFIQLLGDSSANRGGDDFGVMREAWIEYALCDAATIRMGLVKTATTRQLMTPPELQQFVDVSLGSAFVGLTMPGYSDRNRDYGVMVHGGFGCDDAFTYLVTVTNGDGPVHRNVLDGQTDDPLALSARVNWDLRGHMGYEEGALRQQACDWTAAVGAWAHTYADHLIENPLVKKMDRLTYGVDAAFGWGGLSVTAAYSVVDWTGSDLAGTEFDGYAWLAQVGYLFPDTAWEVAARASAHSREYDVTDDYRTFSGMEYAFAVTYYIDGHADKVTLDVAFLSAEDDGNFLADVYTGYSATDTSDATLIRLQWQLAL